jgi:hypothetical protein
MPTPHHLSVGLAALAAASSIVVSWLAYFMGKKYFIKGANNTIALEHYRRALDTLNPLKAGLVEHERLIGLIFDPNMADGALEALSQEIANNHNALDEGTRGGLHISGLDQIRSLYLAWYSKWLINSEDEHSFMSLTDPKKRQKVRDQLFKPINTELKEIIESVEKLKLKEEPRTGL